MQDIGEAPHLEVPHVLQDEHARSLPNSRKMDATEPLGFRARRCVESGMFAHAIVAVVLAIMVVAVVVAIVTMRIVTSMVEIRIVALEVTGVVAVPGEFWCAS